MVVLSHAMPNNGRYDFASNIDLGLSTTNMQYVFAYLFNNCGQIANCIFIVISAFFLLESHSVKTKKVWHMIGDTYFITVALIVVFALIDREVESTYVLKFFVPFAAGLNWFITAYIILYCIHPMLNILIEKLSVKNLFLFNALFVCIYNILALLLNRTSYFNTNLLDFIGIYFMVGFIKRLLQGRNYKYVGKRLLIIGIAGWFISVAILNILGVCIALFQGRMHTINHFSNPFFICIGIGSVLIASTKFFYSKWINKLSSMSLLIYVIHAHRYVIDFLRFRVFDKILEKNSFQYLCIWIFIVTVAMLLISYAISIVYIILIQKIIHRVSELLGAKIENILLTLAAQVEKYSEVKEIEKNNDCERQSDM